MHVASAFGVDPACLQLPNAVNLPSVGEMALPYVPEWRLKIPSMLLSLKEIYRLDPDRIYISTPGPVGLLGLLAAGLMGLRTTGFFHTDFRVLAREIAEDESVGYMVDSYTRWFYSRMDEIMVPSGEHLRMLAERGFDRAKLLVFDEEACFDEWRESCGLVSEGRQVDGGTFKKIA